MDNIARAFPSLTRIELAREPDFTLGALRIRPSRREVQAAGARHLLQRRVMQVLVALAHPTAEVVSHEELIRRCWGGLAVGEDAIGRCIGQLRRFASQWAEPPFEIETIAGVGYRLDATAGGGVLAAPPGRTAVWRDRRAWNVLGGALVAALLVGAAVWVARQPGSAGAPPPSRVAVLPLQTLSAGRDVRNLADSISEEMLTVLSANQVEALPPGDAAGLRGPGAGQAAAKLGVGLVVDGAVRLDGDQTRVSVRLNDARTYVTLWSADYHRDTAAAADLGVEVAAKVADIVEMAEFARTTPPVLKDDTALSAMLEAHDLIRSNRPDAWARLLELSQQLVAVAPDFPFGHSMLATANADAVRWNVMPQQSAAMEATARREADRALAMDPHDAAAYFALAMLARTYRERDAILLKGLAAGAHPAPPFGAINTRESFLLQDVGRLRDSLPYSQRALALDPLSPPKNSNTIWWYATMGHAAASRELLDQSLARWPNHRNIRAARLHVLAFYGAPDEALAVLDDPAKRPSDLAPRAIAMWRTFLEAKRAGRALSPPIARAIAAAGDAGDIDPGYAAMMLSSLGETDLAFEQAGKALKAQDDDPSFLFTPQMAPLRRDPRFMPLAARIGLLDYWRSTGKWPDFCVGAHPEVDCRAAAAKAGV